jgi:predicted transcriptional regulator
VIGSFFASNNTCEICRAGYQSSCIHRRRGHPDSALAEAVRIMREKALRRIPVVEDGRPVGMVSIGDLAVERD